MVAPLELEERTYDRRASHRFFEEILTNVSAMPGVEWVSLVDAVPGGFRSRTRRSVDIEGYTPRQDEDMQIDASLVGPGYFTNMNVPLVLGRDFTVSDRDGAPCVAIINDAFAARYLAQRSHCVRQTPDAASRRRGAG